MEANSARLSGHQSHMLQGCPLCGQCEPSCCDGINSCGHAGLQDWPQVCWLPCSVLCGGCQATDGQGQVLDDWLHSLRVLVLVLSCCWVKPHPRAADCGALEVLVLLLAHQWQGLVSMRQAAQPGGGVLGLVPTVSQVGKLTALTGSREDSKMALASTSVLVVK